MKRCHQGQFLLTPAHVREDVDVAVGQPQEQALVGAAPGRERGGQGDQDIIMAIIMASCFDAVWPHIKDSGENDEIKLVFSMAAFDVSCKRTNIQAKQQFFIY